MALSAKVLKSLNDMFKKTSKELEQIKDKRSEDTVDGMAARNELMRRQSNKETKKYGTEKEPFEPYKKGGMVKKPAAKKTVAKKTVAKKPAVKTKSR
jgi:hypothetical protein